MKITMKSMVKGTPLQNHCILRNQESAIKAARNIQCADNVVHPQTTVHNRRQMPRPVEFDCTSARPRAMKAATLPSIRSVDFYLDGLKFSAASAP